MDDPEDLKVTERVRKSYDAIGHFYTAQRSSLATAEPYLNRLTELLPRNSTVLDLGCGAGVPIDQALLKMGFTVLGLDISPKQVEQARALNANGRFEVKDILALQPGEYEVDAVVSFFAIFHVPRREHVSVLAVARSFLRENGLLLITMGASEDEGWDDFFGSEMYWSHYGPEENRRMVEQAGFLILLDEIDTSFDERHQVLLAQAK